MQKKRKKGKNNLQNKKIVVPLHRNRETNLIKHLKIMEYMNQVILRGRVGCIRRQEFEKDAVTTFSLCVTTEVEGKAGKKKLETTWLNCEAWDSRVADVAYIEKGADIIVCGRLRSTKFTSADNVERTMIEVVVFAVVKPEKNK